MASCYVPVQCNLDGRRAVLLGDLAATATTGVRPNGIDRIEVDASSVSSELRVYFMTTPTAAQLAAWIAAGLTIVSLDGTVTVTPVSTTADPSGALVIDVGPTDTREYMLSLEAPALHPSFSHARFSFSDGEWPALTGIDYVEVDDDTLAHERLIRVYFVRDHAPPQLAGHPELFTVSGGVRVTAIQVLSVTLVDDHLVVEVDRAGDFSLYTLEIAPQDGLLDPILRCRSFGFRATCPTPFDCRPAAPPAPPPEPAPAIDYLAKDYASFRQALLSFAPSLVPTWTEGHEADLGMALVEVLAYAGDYLSYYQDAVSNEAWLPSARQRISVRRHVRLIDYPMHDGAAARAFVRFEAASIGVIPNGSVLLTRIEAPVGGVMPPFPTQVSFPYFAGDSPLSDEAIDTADVAFLTMADLTVQPQLSKIDIYTWGDSDCCVTAGATMVDLKGIASGAIKAGDFLLFEEVKGGDDANAAEADPGHRQVVCVTSVDAPVSDTLSGGAISVTRVYWAAADALLTSFCVSTTLVDGTKVAGMTVVRGNVTLARHGRRCCEWHPAPPVAGAAGIITRAPRGYQYALTGGPMSFVIPWDPGAKAPAANLFSVDPHAAIPDVRARVLTDASDALGSPASWQADLLDVGPLDVGFVVETDNAGFGHLRFGDGTYGEALDDGNFIEAHYTIGVGVTGNVGAGAITHIVLPPDVSAFPQNITLVANPLPAWGGIDPEPMERVRRVAPALSATQTHRAVTERDYANAAKAMPGVADAVATFRWTGSWHTVFLSIDPVGSTSLTASLRQAVLAWVTGYTQAGYDLELEPAVYVPLAITIDVCVAPQYFAADVEAAVLAALSNRRLPDGTLGSFYPDNYRFAQSVYLSALYAAVLAVPGVAHATVTQFQRYGQQTRGELAAGAIEMRRTEIARLDNDPNFPEMGTLTLVMEGGQ